jgi:integrase
VHVVAQKVGNGKSRRDVRRALLVDKFTGLLRELPTTYVSRHLGQKSLNTQIAVLYDLAFYFEWSRLKLGRSIEWICPEERVRRGQLALTSREINDLANWCQASAADLANACRREAAALRFLAPFDAVESKTTNRRIMYICGYLTWLTAEMVEGTLKLDDKDLARSEKYQASIRQAFHSTINGVKSAAPLRSLDAMASNAVRDVVANASLFPATHHGRRDRLITRILLETGLRAGELLKLRCEDVDDRYEIKPGHIVGIIRVIRRPNDSEDERTIEPAVKTLPGPVLVSKHLAQQIKQYVVQDRRAAMDAGRRTRETPYLFVCHSGKQVGKPISRRNLNSIVSKLRKVNEVPAWLSPHTLRHTHFTELFEILSSQKVGEAEAQRIMQERGHWSPNSQMPAHYTRRATEVRQADFVEQRDALFE